MTEHRDEKELALGEEAQAPETPAPLSQHEEREAVRRVDVVRQQHRVSAPQELK